MAMLCGALSWLSKAIVKGLFAGAASSAVENFRSFAEIWIAFGSADAAGPEGAAVVPAPEHAARTRTSTRRARAGTRRFIGNGSCRDTDVAAPGSRVAIPAVGALTMRRTVPRRGEPGRRRGHRPPRR